MGHVLTALEQSLLLSQVHPELPAEMNAIDYLNSSFSDLAYPEAGRAVRWPDDSYTLVWRDASRRWWFIDVTSKFANEVNKPDYVSVDSSFLDNVIQETAEMIRAAVKAAMPVFESAPLLIALALVLVLRSK